MANAIEIDDAARKIAEALLMRYDIQSALLLTTLIKSHLIRKQNAVARPMPKLSASKT